MLNPFHAIDVSFKQMQASTATGVSFDILGDITLPLTGKADSKATALAWTGSSSRVMAVRIGNWDSRSFYQPKIS